jgi:hypothetical protein
MFFHLLLSQGENFLKVFPNAELINIQLSKVYTQSLLPSEGREQLGEHLEVF